MVAPIVRDQRVCVKDMVEVNVARMLVVIVQLNAKDDAQDMEVQHGVRPLDVWSFLNLKVYAKVMVVVHYALKMDARKMRIKIDFVDNMVEGWNVISPIAENGLKNRVSVVSTLHNLPNLDPLLQLQVDNKFCHL